MDDDEYPLSDTDDLSTTADFGETARARQAGRRRNRSDTTLRYASDNFSSDRYMLHWNYNGEATSSPAASSALLSVAEHQPDSDEDDESITEETANLSLRAQSPPTTASAAAAMPSSGEPPTAASQRPPRPGIIQSAGSASPGELSAPPRDSSSDTSPRSSLPPAAAAAHSPPVVASGQQYFGGSHSQSPPPAAAAADAAASHGPFHQVPEGFEHAVAYIKSVKMRFHEHPEVYDKFLVTIRAFLREQEIDVVLNEVLELFADHADLLRGFSDFFPNNLRSWAEAQLEIAAAAAEQRAKHCKAQEANAPSPMLASPQGAASPANFAPSPTSLPPAAHGVPSNTPRGDQQGCIGDAQNKSAIGVAELELSIEEESDKRDDEETHDDVAKVLFEEEAEEMSDESKEDADNTPVICDVCQDLTVFNRTADTLGIGGTWCCQSCNVDTFLLSQTTDGSVASSHHSIRSRPQETMTSLYAEDYKNVSRQKSTKFCGFKGDKQIKRRKIYTTWFGSGQAAQLALQCLILAMESTINPDGSVNWSGVIDQLTRPLNQFKFELQEDVGMLASINDDVARRHLNMDDIRGDGNVVATALMAVAEYLENIPAKKQNEWKLKSKILKKIAEELTGIAENIGADEDAEFPWVMDGSKKSYDFPDKEQWRRENEKFMHELGNGNLHYSVTDICRRLEAVMAHFGCHTTEGGNPSPPSEVTKVRGGCLRQLMAAFSLSALFEGFLCDPFCGEKNFNDYIHGDPSRMSTKERKAALVKFLRDTGVIPEWYIPFFLGDLDEINFNLNARPEEIEKMKEDYKDWIGEAENLDRLRKERQQMEDMAKHLEALRAEHLRRCKVDGRRLRKLIDDYCHSSTATVIPLVEFKDEFTRELQDIDGLDKLSANDFPSLRSADESIWQNNDHRMQRQCILGKLLREVFAVLYPPEINGIDLKRVHGDCAQPNCRRNCLNGCVFQGAHVDATMKNHNPYELAKAGSEKLIEEMEGPGLDPKCSRHHDGAEENRGFELDASKHHLLSPPQNPLGRDKGRDFLQILRDDRVRRLQYCLCIMDCYGRGLMQTQHEKKLHYCDYNTLRVMFLAYFNTVADDVMMPSAKEWNTCNTRHFIVGGLKHVVQNNCGVCFAANQPGTSEAKNKLQENWKNDDYACHETNYDFREYAPVERQRIEGDHTYSKEVSGRKKLSACQNIFEMFEEICHAPFHCYDCHKRRTANQNPRKPDRDYTIG